MSDLSDLGKEFESMALWAYGAATILESRPNSETDVRNLKRISQLLSIASGHLDVLRERAATESEEA